MAPSRLCFGALLLAFVLVCSPISHCHASECQDVLVANIKVTSTEAKTICAACSALLPLNQCVACYRQSTDLMTALQCPTGGAARAMVTRELEASSQHKQAAAGGVARDLVVVIRPVTIPGKTTNTIKYGRA